MKICLVFVLLIAVSVSAQVNDSTVYQFINFKIEQDSLFTMPLVKTNANISTKSIEQYKSDMVAHYFRNAEPGSLNWDKIDSIYDSLLDSNTLSQLKSNNRQKKWDRDLIMSRQPLTKELKYGRRYNKTFQPCYSISRPVFFNNGTNLFIEINLFWRPSVGNGYFEVYQKEKEGSWKRVHKRCTWMS